MGVLIAICLYNDMSLHLTQQFRRTIEDDSSKCILWVGTGLSVSGVRQGGKGLPDWETLMQHMINDLRDSENCDTVTIAKLEQWIKEGKFLQIAEVFSERTRPDQFASFIKTELDPSDIIPSKLHETILRCNFRGIITTNFDMVFEHQSNRLAPLVYPQCIDNIDGFRRHGFFAKIHGCVRNTHNLSENLVLKEKSYKTLRANPKYHTILRSCFVMHPILTVGFSLRDPDFLGLLTDLREIFHEETPTIYALMLDPGHKERDKWRKQGVEIIPYKNHTELFMFFGEMLQLSEQKHPVPTVLPVSRKSEINYDALLEKWQRAQKIEEMYQIVQQQIDILPKDEKESFLLQFLSLLKKNDQILLFPHMIKLGTKLCERVLISILENAQDNIWQILKPHPLYLNVYNWAIKNWPNFTWPDFAKDPSKECFEWLLDKNWVEHGVDIYETFFSLLNRIVSRRKMNEISDLYAVCQHVENAPERIEKIVFSPDFVREDDPKREWFKSWDIQNRESVRFGKFKKIIISGMIDGYRNQLAEAFKMDSELPEKTYRDYTGFVLDRLFDEYVQRIHLTLHSSSDLYDPEKAHEIFEALAEIKGTKRQLTILWAINNWHEGRRGLISLGEDIKSLREGLFIPLWWRYSSETRIEYLKEHKHGRMHEILWITGQEFLLENMMGFTYDIDKDFRRAFDASLNQHLATDGYCKYEPRPFQEVWRDRELNYKFSNKVPQELIRRIAVKRIDWDNSEPSRVRWQEALERAAQRMETHNLADFVSGEKQDYVIDNLLGAYFPNQVEVVLYPVMIEYAAADLCIDKEALSTIVYIHETVHAFSHIGKDHDGNAWTDFSIPLANAPDFRPSRFHEAIAQFYTFKLLEILKDQKLIQAFLKLEQHCIDVYREWRTIKDYGLEQMREVIVRYRRKAQEWPPVL